MTRRTLCRNANRHHRPLGAGEPTAALGVPEQRKVIELIRRLRQQNVAVIFISHNLADIFAVADRILVLRRGLAAGERRPEASSHERSCG